MKRAIFFLFFCAAAAQSQAVHFGVKGGVPFGDPNGNLGHLAVDSDHWTVGPTAEFRLPAHLWFELDALYSSYTVHYPVIVNPGQPPFTQFTSTGDARAWDFPAALKFRFRGGKGPFVLGGVNYRRENSDVRIRCSAPAGQTCTGSSYETSQDRLGPVFGAGTEWIAGRIRFAPEFRYVHLNRPGANQYSLLFGITF